MAIPRLMDSVDSEDASYRPYINTGGPLDIINGKFIPSTSDTWILSGGAGLTTSFIGGPNTFKSTANNGCMINCMARFPDSEGYLLDSEYATVDKRRLASMSSLCLDDKEARTAHVEDVAGRLKVYDPTTPQGDSLDAWFDFLKELRDFKIKNYKDFEVETEILNPDTMKAHRMMLPTFIGIDSWTEAHVVALNNKNEEIDADTEMSKQRTVFMEEGLKKAMLMRQLPSICAKAGFSTFLTGHLGKKFSIDGKPQKKEMTYMGQDEAVKAMGPKFPFLMSSLFKIDKAAELTQKDDRTRSEYPSNEGVGGKELQELMITMVRCKNAPSGAQTQMVSSQRFGIMNALSYYNYLRNNKYYGLGSPNKVRNPLLDNLDIGRTKIFTLSKEYKVSRALELTYQLFVIQSTWTLMGQPVDYSIPIEQFAEQLLKSGYAVDDILNSRGWWTYNGAKGPDIDRPYLTLPDILNILSGAYKPKFLPVS